MMTERAPMAVSSVYGAKFYKQVTNKNLLFTHLDPRWCYGVSAVFWDSHCMIYGRRLGELIETSICNESDY